jgi:hypothetical protein
MPAARSFRPIAFVLALAVTLTIVAGVDALARPATPSGGTLVQDAAAAGCAAG